MEDLFIQNELFEVEKEGCCGKECEVRKIMDLNGGIGEKSISSSDFLASDEHSSFQDSSSQPSTSESSDNVKFEKQDSSLSEFKMMKERFSKLLLGEDMSGCGNGVCSALAISNAITNLYATIFGKIWRLEPLELGKKLMWRREMGWIVSVSDHIVELMPSWQTFPDGSKLEEILDSFEDSEFWYVDQGNIVTPNVNGSSSLRKPLPSQEDKWWLPVPRVPLGGLSENTRKMLQHTRDCTNQILKAAMAINSAVLAEMDIPNSYIDALPKNGKASLGDLIHRYINSDQFSPECLLDCLDLSSDHHALEIANRVETTMFVWRRKNTSKPSKFNSKTSWEMVKDLVSDGDKWEQLSDRAESLLLCLKQRFPGLPQTTLDMTKIQHNKDVGKSILESYSRVLESLAFNIVSRIDDLLYVDDLSKHSDHRVPFSKSVVPSLHISTSPYKAALSSPYIEISKHHLHGFGLKRILTDHMSSVDGKGKVVSKNKTSFDSFSSTTPEMSASTTLESSSSDSSKGIISPPSD